MAFYRFHLDVTAPPTAVAERLRSITGEKIAFFDGTSFHQPNPCGEPFKGAVSAHSFKLRRDTRRNSCVPMIRGHFLPTSTGTRITVTMYLNPLLAAFIVLWMPMVASSGFSKPLDPFGWGILLIVIAVVTIIFVLEAMKAKRLITAAAMAAPPAATPKAIG